jgi:hypothetical protein
MAVTEALKADDGKIWYCAAYTVKKKGRWRARMEYFKAEDLPRAKLAFAAGMPAGYAIGYNVEIQAIAPVIGVFEDEEKMQKGVRLDNVLSLD